jgi:SulP family sulfate permease
VKLKAIPLTLTPDTLFRAVVAGVVIAVLNVFVEISFAALIFSGELAAFLQDGIGLLLFGGFALGLVTVLTTSFASAISVPQDTSAAILALVAAGVAVNMPAGASPQETYYTVVAAIVVSSLLTALIYLLIGFFRLGGLVRFIPYPVFGGFLAGTGWLLATGALAVMADAEISMAGLGLLLQPGAVVKWLPGLIFAVAVLLVVRRTGKVQAILWMLLGGMVLFYLALPLAGVTFAEASAAGWLLGPFPERALWRPLTPAALPAVDWRAVLSQAANIATLPVIAIIALLLNASGLELVARENIDFNRELKSAGLANLAAGLGGSPVGFPALSLSALAFRIGGKTRLVGLTAALVMGAALLFGASLLGFFPKAVLGGLLLFLGLSFLADWVYDAWFTLPRSEYALVILILVIVAAFGFLQGVAAGVLMSVALFAVNYSRLDIVKQQFSGASYRSNVDRAAHHQRMLNEHGSQMHVIKLQGYIFFGTANDLYEQVRRRAAHEAGAAPLRFAVLDFLHVSRLDSSALNSFTKLRQLAEARGFALVFTQVSPGLRAQFAAGGFEQDAAPAYRFFPDLDHGVEWCENQVLQAEAATAPEMRRALPELLMKAFPDELDYSDLLNYLERLDVPQGETLIHENGKVEYLYLLESGMITAYLDDPERGRVRLRTIGPGAMIGELGFVLGYPASATVVTDLPSSVYRMSKENLKRLEAEQPQLAAAFHKLVTLFLGERLSNTTNTLRALLD